ncbi:MAG TPA: glycosyl hydrolase [Steroidobacteraceae bacterium]|jgi:hypothetical protein|nr:glycosyl hydrolase [Steroidobacteraceae bacterium]
MLTRRSFLSTVGAAGVIVGVSRAGTRGSGTPTPQSADPMAGSFQSPPREFKPWAYWWWLDGAVTEAGITADLEAMRQQGIAGVLLFNAGIAGPGAPKGPPFMSGEWRAHFRHALAEAGRLGLDLSVNLCSGWNAGGPWVTRDDAIKHFVWQETVIEGPRAFDAELPRYVERPPGGVSIASSESPSGFALDDPTAWYRDVAVLACAEEHGGVWKLGDVRDLTGQMSDGRLHWAVPKGTWRVLRMGCIVRQYDEENGDASIRTKTRPPQDAAAWEIDPMSADAMDRHFAETGAKLIEDAGSLAGPVLKYVHIDSWELGIPTWTPKLIEEFAARRRYSPLLYLAGLAGKTVESPEITRRFLWDYRRTIADLIAANYYGRLAQLAHAKGLGTHPESGGPWYTQYIDGLECLGTNDIPMAEFWSSRASFQGFERNPAIYSQGVASEFFKSAEPAFPQANFGSIKQAASAAHIYGKPLCQAEAFTNFNPDWTEDPYFLKSFGDRAFCLGLTRNVLCFFVSQPSLTDKPGYEWQYTGLHVDRNVTWWPKSGAWLSYLARCQFLLRQGSFCADLLYFTGEAIPNFALRDRKPVAGYDFDVINAQALLARAQAKNGRVVLPDGVAYRYLVIPDGAADSMTPAVMAKLRALVEGGATVVGARPKGSLGLTDYPHSQQEVEKTAHDLWGDDASAPGRKIGAGRVIWGRPLSAIIESDGLAPDVEFRGVPADAQLDWVHRSDGNCDIYFIANLSESPTDLSAVLRVSGRTPELWDPVTGDVRDLDEFEVDGARTAVPLHLEAKQSAFVVFRKVSRPHASPRRRNAPVLRETARIGGPWRVSFDPKWGGPQSAVFEQLDDWSKRPEESIRHYSGTATYRNRFKVSAQAPGRLYLYLGFVKNVAQVRINGHDAGIVWTAPWRVAIGGLVRSGENDLEIEVVNLWPNRLIGDAGLPQERRMTKTNVTTYAARLPPDFFCAWDAACEERKQNGTPAALLPSGLLGPVRIVAAD